MRYFFLYLTFIGLLFVGCCLVTPTTAPNKLQIPDGPSRPQLSEIVVFKPDGDKFVKFRPTGKYVAPDDCYIGVKPREIEALFQYISQLETYSNGLKNHPMFEVNKND